MVDPSESYWNAHGVKLVNSATNQDVCQNIEIRSYGVVECLTIQGTIDSGTVVAAQSLETNTIAVCNNTNAGTCTYEQLETGSFPAVSSVSSSVAGQIVFTGTNFFTSGYTANVQYAGISADQVTIDSAT